MRIHLVVTICLSCVSCLGGSKLASYYSYHLDGDSIDWPSRNVKNIYTSSGRYTPRNIIPTRFQTMGYEAVLAFPRLRPGVPITLGKVQLKFGKSTPKVQPFPSWELQQEGSRDAIQSAVDLSLDQRNVLWVLDTGVVNSMDMPTKRGSPKIWGIDFRTGKIVRVIDLLSLAEPQSRLQYLVADVAPDGDLYLYVADAENSALLVWNVDNNRGFRVPLPAATTKRDILYIFMVRRKLGESLLVFTYFSGRNVCAVRVSDLQKGQCGEVIDLGVKPGSIVPLGTDNGSVLFFRSKSDSKIYEWDADSGKKMNGFALVQSSVDSCRFCTQVTGGCRHLMWSLDSNFQDYIRGIIGCVGASVTIHPLVKNSS